MSGKAFGRDEMNALFGGPGGEASEEMAAFRPSQPQNPHAARRTTANQEVDISKLTAAETAKLLLEKKSGPQAVVVNNASRYRSQSKKVLAHHQLLAEELSKQQHMESLASEPIASRAPDPDHGDDESDEEFVRSKRQVQAAVVLSRRSGDRRRRRRTDSSSSSSGDEDRRGASDRKTRRDRRRQNDDSSSSSSSDEEDDRSRRNRRAMASRRNREDEPEIIVPKERSTSFGRKKPQAQSSDDGPARKTTNQRVESRRDANDPKPLQTNKSKPRRKSSSSSSDGSSSGSSSSSESSSSESSSSSSSEEDNEPVRLKPMFVPKHKRNLVQSEEKKWEEEELRLKREEERTLKRKAESRALLAKELAAAESSLHNDPDEDLGDEYAGTINAPPDDYDDDTEKDKERNAWELRELDRLLRSMDEQEHRRKEEEEYARRKKLSDAECLKEDMASGRYQAPGANRSNTAGGGGESTAGANNPLKRFFHRGAFYMDESEWDEGDIRQKAAEYAMADTEEDKIDVSKLPEVMQVKNFGRARQNTKYKGLAKEDTTDKSAHILPLRRQLQKK